jgi:hypothetical protein
MQQPRKGPHLDSEYYCGCIVCCRGSVRRFAKGPGTWAVSRCAQVNLELIDGINPGWRKGGVLKPEPS